MRSIKINKRTLPKRKAATAVKPATKKAKEKIKPKFNLKGIPAKYKLVCSLVLTYASSQTECDELLLAGVNAFETLHETENPETAAKLEEQIVTKAILLKKESYSEIRN